MPEEAVWGYWLRPDGYWTEPAWGLFGASLRLVWSCFSGACPPKKWGRSQELVLQRNLSFPLGLQRLGLLGHAPSQEPVLLRTGGLSRATPPKKWESSQ